MTTKLEANEFPPYFEQYIKLITEGNIVNILEEQLHEMTSLFSQLTDDQADFRYAEGKWSVKEVLGHITDNERIWAYRILRIARGDNHVCKSYDENQFAAESSFHLQQIDDLLEEFIVVRRSTIMLLKGLKDKAWLRSGTLYDAKLTVRAAAYVIAGHEKHHRGVLEARYGLGSSQ
ncbi:hypothetical protein Back11_00380 [Paenibacillus baekrokdamisoli]|uniref:Uncharacterized protein n=1 Tax=Paenibacillus baekrokdamisoli TaxID=1712516 RepID=A0A3G9J1Z3_9BACL|nr:DinB family protein [Paenibacillus baekrokdamisoli]MBB3069337.1 putative damage-inducible protein DinB [Paenibacillus baekrokdamisoli]BBH18693.1 hypothetical protein Back11_00380 [Paenibacillus baekrokdamisoli]